jgi:hypothetical protein
VALADELADAVEEKLGRRIGLDLRHALRTVGNHVDPLQPLEGVRVDEVGAARPVVADDQHVARTSPFGGHRRRRQHNQAHDNQQPCQRAPQFHRTPPRAPSRASTLPPATLTLSVCWATVAKCCSDMEPKNGTSFDRA